MVCVTNVGAIHHQLFMRSHTLGGVYVDDLTEHIIKHPSEIPGLLERGNNIRETASTNMNKTSSRSHAVFTIIVEHSVILPDCLASVI